MVLVAAALLPGAARAGEPGAPPLVVVMDDNYPPYVFRDSNGALTGYLVDYWQLWQGKTGVPVDVQASDWELAKQRMASGQATVIDTIFQTPEREKTLDFTPAYAQIPVSIYTHADIGGIAGLDNLTGFLVGVKAGDACIDTLEAAGIKTLQPYPNYEALVQAAIAGRVRIFCLDDPPANYLLYRDHARDQFNKAFQLNVGEFRRAVHKGDAATMALLQRGFAAIGADEEQALRDKWMGTRLTQSGYARPLGLALLAATLLGLVLLLWGWVMRRRVAERTRELDGERARLRALLQAIPDLVWMKDMAGVYRYCNPMFERFFGASEAQIVGKTDYDFVDKDLADFFRAHDQKAIAADEPTINEEWITFADDGHHALLETTKTPLRDATGALAGVLGIARDITRRKQAEQALQQSEYRLHTILDSVEAHIYIKDRQFRYQYVNQSLLNFLDRPPEAIVGHEDAAFFDAQTAAMVRANDRRVIEQGERVAMEETVVRSRDGATSVHYSVKLPLRDKDGTIYALCGISTDMTARKELENSLRISATAFESQEGMLITDANSVILRINQSFARMCGYSPQEVIGQTPRMLSSQRHDEAFYKAMWDSVHATGQWQGEIWDRRKNGEVYPAWMTLTAVKNDQGVVTNYVATHIDITERKSYEEQIHHLAFFDPLTTLPNRRLLADRLQQALALRGRTRREGALLFIDLDHFKTLNDTLGHDVGDLLLQEVARRISACVREGDTVARLGGDEFVVMLENLSTNPLEAASQAENVGEKILGVLCQPSDLKGHEYRGTASIGLTLFGTDGSEDLMKRADVAMYQAKADGRNNLRFFDPSMQAEITRRAALEVDLREGIRQRQFVPHYQPQINALGQAVGVELLVRWQHPVRGLVPPAEFIPLAEETGLILPLGALVLETACAQLAAWAGHPALADLSIAVNVSARQLYQDDFVDQVLAALQRAQARPQRLKLELTESLLVSHIDATVEKMLALKTHGVGFALDDFGTGYSSLSYLKRLPLDQLKIDQSFVRDILVDPNDAAIAKTIVALAESMGLTVIAEGVETEAQRTRLAELGCHTYQGYLLGRPMPVGELEQRLRQDPR